MNKDFVKVFKTLARISFIIGISSMLIGVLAATAYRPATATNWCAQDPIEIDFDAPFNYNGDRVITSVIVKTNNDNNQCIEFDRDRTIDCYQVEGIGTTNVRAREVEVDGRCPYIRHVEFFSRAAITPTATQPPATATFTSTPPGEEPDTPTPTATATATATFTATPTNTTPPSATFTNTPPGEEPPTATPTNTLPPPTATFTSTPPGEEPPTATPTETSPPPTATSTIPPATATNTLPPPTATNTTAAPTATNTQPPATATSTSTAPGAPGASFPSSTPTRTQVVTLAAPNAAVSGTPALIPLTGVDFVVNSEVLYYQRIFLGFGFGLIGLGLVFRGIANRLNEESDLD